MQSLDFQLNSARIFILWFSDEYCSCHDRNGELFNFSLEHQIKYIYLFIPLFTLNESGTCFKITALVQTFSDGVWLVALVSNWGCSYRVGYFFCAHPSHAPQCFVSWVLLIKLLPLISSKIRLDVNCSTNHLFENVFLWLMSLWCCKFLNAGLESGRVHFSGVRRATDAPWRHYRVANAHSTG